MRIQSENVLTGLVAGVFNFLKEMQYTSFLLRLVTDNSFLLMTLLVGVCN